MTKSAAAQASRMGNREAGEEAGGRIKNRKDWLWNLTTLNATSDDISM